MLESSEQICYSIDTRGTTAHKVVGLITLIEIPPRHSAKVLGWFFYVALLTKRKYESKQCQKKYAKCQHILEIKMISHRHHPHSIRIEADPPCNTVVPVLILP